MLNFISSSSGQNGEMGDFIFIIFNDQLINMHITRNSVLQQFRTISHREKV